MPPTDERHAWVVGRIVLIPLTAVGTDGNALGFFTPKARVAVDGNGEWITHPAGVRAAPATQQSIRIDVLTRRELPAPDLSQEPRLQVLKLVRTRQQRLVGLNGFFGREKEGRVEFFDGGDRAKHPRPQR